MALPMSSLAGLLLPTWCPGCGRPDVPVCRACLAALAVPARRVHPPVLPPGCPAWACTEHADAAARLVVAWKDRGRHDLAPVLSRVLARAVQAAARRAGGELVLVPIPSSRAARRRRGEDGVRRLCLMAAARLRREGHAGADRVRVAAVLRQRRRVADQAGLGAPARRRNLAGALAVPSSCAGAVAGRRCVVVDDIVTTGSTVTEAAGALVACGAHVVAVAAISATPRRDALFAGQPRV
jgi:predicted amidophosphoribosyltransferase